MAQPPSDNEESRILVLHLLGLLVVVYFLIIFLILFGFDIHVPLWFTEVTMTDVHAHIQAYQFVPLSSFQTTTSTKHSSHTLRYEMGCFSIHNPSYRLCVFCPKLVREYEYHTFFTMLNIRLHLHMLSAHPTKTNPYIHSSHNPIVHSQL